MPFAAACSQLDDCRRQGIDRASEGIHSHIQGTTRVRKVRNGRAAARDGCDREAVMEEQVTDLKNNSVPDDTPKSP